MNAIRNRSASNHCSLTTDWHCWCKFFCATTITMAPHSLSFFEEPIFFESGFRRTTVVSSAASYAPADTHTHKSFVSTNRAHTENDQNKNKTHGTNVRHTNTNPQLISQCVFTFSSPWSHGLERETILCCACIICLCDDAWRMRASTQPNCMQRIWLAYCQMHGLVRKISIIYCCRLHNVKFETSNPFYWKRTITHMIERMTFRRFASGNLYREIFFFVCFQPQYRQQRATANNIFSFDRYMSHF